MMGNVEVIGMREVADWLSPLLHSPAAMKLVNLFGGDRASCCDEAVAIKVNGQIVALASIAPRGEMGSGQPTIVGVYVMLDVRRQRLGSQVLGAAIRRCSERHLVPVRIETMSEGISKLIEQLPQELRTQLDVHDMGAILDMFPG